MENLQTLGEGAAGRAHRPKDAADSSGISRKPCLLPQVVSVGSFVLHVNVAWRSYRGLLKVSHSSHVGSVNPAISRRPGDVL